MNRQCLETRGEKHEDGIDQISINGIVARLNLPVHYQLKANYLKNNAGQSATKRPDTATEKTVIVLFLQRYENTRDLKKLSKVCDRSFFRLLRSFVIPFDRRRTKLTGGARVAYS